VFKAKRDAKKESSKSPGKAKGGREERGSIPAPPLLLLATQSERGCVAREIEKGFSGNRSAYASVLENSRPACSDASTMHIIVTNVQKE